MGDINILIYISLITPLPFSICKNLLFRPPYPEATEFRRNADYSLYVLTINCVVMGLLPFSLLIWMNLSIARYFSHDSAGTDM